MNSYNKKDKIRDLEAELLLHPLGSKRYRKIREEIEKENSHKPNNRYFICFPNKFSKHKFDNQMTNDVIYRLDKIREVQDFLFDDPNDDFASPMLFVDNMSFPEDFRFMFIPVSKAETDLSVKQLTVASYITDGESIVLLFSKKGRIVNKYTLIQGHVEFDTNCYLVNQFEFLRQNMLRELSEELKLTDLALQLPDMPKYYINTDTTMTELMHFAIVYEIRVPSIEDIISRIQSGEPEKHDVRWVTIDGCENECDLDTWSQLVVDKLLQEK